MKDLCPIVSYLIVKVIEKKTGEPILFADSSNPFELDSSGKFSVFESFQSYHNYQIFIQAKNQFGITGGDDQYLIDLSYKVYPQFASKIEKMELWKTEKLSIGNKVFPIKVRNDVVFIKIID